jgi:hypothetical protein
MGDDDPLLAYGLHTLNLGHKPIFNLYFSSCRTRLSDYTFANTFIWRDSIHLRWRIIHDCLCVFANGDGGLTLLFPPVGAGDVSAATGECFAICDEYNAAAGLTDWTRMEYVSQEMLDKMGGAFRAEPMSGDYVYATGRLIDLAGGALASKRQARNRFAKRYQARTERFEPRHLAPCLALLGTWRDQTAELTGPRSNSGVKRAKEICAAADAMTNADGLDLTGMVLYAGDKLVGFTFGELLDDKTCSIVIEKTDREYAGSAQYIFSEFCRQYWAQTEFCNVGDDWDVPSLAWTKQSYRPVCRLEKWVLRPAHVPTAAIPARAAAVAV